MDANLQPDYENGDILIKRVTNGWMAIIANGYAENQTQTFVYEDKEMPNWIGESLYQLLSHQFEAYLQSKRNPGIKMAFSTLSKESEEDDI